MEKVSSTFNSSEKRQLSKGLAQIILGLIITDILFGKIVNYTLKKQSSKSGVFRISKSLKARKKTIFIGNSRIVNNINPEISLNPNHTINLGFYETGFKFWYIYLEAVAKLKLNNKYVLDLADGEFIGETYPSKQIKKLLLPNLKVNDIKTNEISYNFFEKLLSFTNSFNYRFIIPNIIQAFVSSKKSNGHINLGDKPICSVGLKCKKNPNENKNFSPEIKVKDHYYFNKIIDLIKKHKLDVTLLLTPIHSRGVILTHYKEKSLLMAAKYLESKDLKVLNYSMDKRFRNKDNLFFDLNHLNEKGSKKFTQIILGDLGIPIK